MFTLSVSSSTSAPPAATGSPVCLSQRPTVASTIASPRAGTRISTAMLSPQLLSIQRIRAVHLCHDRRPCAPLHGLGDDPGLLDRVLHQRALGWAGRRGAADVDQRDGRVEQLAQPRFDVAPRAHVAWLLL